MFSNMTSMKSCNVYCFNEKCVVWNWDNHCHDVSQIPSDNLCIVDDTNQMIWNMRDIIQHEDICVDLKIISETEMRFITFNGWNVIFDVEQMEMKSKQMTK